MGDEAVSLVQTLVPGGGRGRRVPWHGWNHAHMVGTDTKSWGTRTGDRAAEATPEGSAPPLLRARPETKRLPRRKRPLRRLVRRKRPTGMRLRLEGDCGARRVVCVSRRTWRHRRPDREPTQAKELDELLRTAAGPTLRGAAGGVRHGPVSTPAVRTTTAAPNQCGSLAHTRIQRFYFFLKLVETPTIGFREIECSRCCRIH